MAVLAATGLVIGIALPVRTAKAAPPATGETGIARPNAYVQIGADSVVTVIVKHIEWGQGINTGLATLVAEELDADWSQMRAVSAPLDTELYGNSLFDNMQVTAGSTSMASSYDLMRRAGATARAMLVHAAARNWAVAPNEIAVKAGLISHVPSGRSAPFGTFAVSAARLSPPHEVLLKDPRSFTLIGRTPAVGRLDTVEKVTGRAMFAIDIYEPDMLTVVVARPPRFGAKPAAVDASAALKIRGVIAVERISSGYAVYANGMWPALKGRQALEINWDETAAESRGSQEITAEYLEITKSLGMVVGAKGNVEAVFSGNVKIIEETYSFPYLAHAPMEPLDGYIHWDGKTCQTRYGCPIQSLDQGALADVLGLPQDKVFIDTMYAGGSFGRRGPANLHFAVELAECAKAIGPGKHLKLVWTREDDIRGGCYRPLFVHRMRGVVEDGKIVAWSDGLAGQSLFSGTPVEQTFEKNGIDPYMIEGSSELIYKIDNFRCDAHKRMSPITTTPWRSTGYSHTLHAVECFVDLLLEKCGKDPVKGRLEILDGRPRAAAALEAVARIAEWKGPSEVNGRARGVALIEGYGSVWVAQIAEVSLGKHGEPVVHKIWCAVDCGLVINPDVVRAQVEGGIAWGLGHALYGEVRILAGTPAISNFDGYHTLRIDQMPEIEILIMPSTEPPSGIGELGAPAAGPAIANALARLTGSRPTQMPFGQAA